MEVITLPSPDDGEGARDSSAPLSGHGSRSAAPVAAASAAGGILRGF
jgi:hypothetical protein